MIWKPDEFSRSLQSSSRATTGGVLRLCRAEFDRLLAAAPALRGGHDAKALARRDFR
jgi:hypothetical protein